MKIPKLGESKSAISIASAGAIVLTITTTICNSFANINGSYVALILSMLLATTMVQNLKQNFVNYLFTGLVVFHLAKGGNLTLSQAEDSFLQNKSIPTENLTDIEASNMEKAQEELRLMMIENETLQKELRLLADEYSYPRNRDTERFPATDVASSFPMAPETTPEIPPEAPPEIPPEAPPEMPLITNVALSATPMATNLNFDILVNELNSSEDDSEEGKKIFRRW